MDKLGKPLKLINDETGEWYDMSLIFEQIAEQWDTLDGKTKAYLATALAGTKQQNIFLALMNDMAKGAEGGSRAYELYAGAMDAAGTASQKYAIWQESVAAAQGRLAASMEGLYGMVNAEWMKDGYDGLAILVDLFVAGSTAMDGWN